MKIRYYIVSILILIISCKASDKSRNYDFVDYDYEIRSYYSNSNDPDNFRYSEFYRNDTLIRKIGREGDCTTFLYDSIGRLVETIWGRNCNYGRRNIWIFDSLGNHIGYYSTMNSVVDLDSVKFEQVFFYDSNNRLIKERTDKRKNMNGEEFEIWKHYSYLNNKIDTEITIQNQDTVWIGRYYYDTFGNVIKIHRVRKKVYETELFKYNKDNVMIEKEIISTANPITPEVAFSAGNNVRKYDYDSTGFKTSEIIYNHNGKAEVKTIYLKIDKN